MGAHPIQSSWTLFNCWKNIQVNLHKKKHVERKTSWGKIFTILVMCSCNESKFEVINWWKMWNDISDIGWKIVHLLRWSNEYSDILYHMLHPNHSLYNDPTSPLVLELNMLIRNLIYLPLTEQVWFSRWCSYWYAEFFQEDKYKISSNRRYFKNDPWTATYSG